MSMNFGSDDGILIRTMTVEDYKLFEGNAFDDEPLTASAVANSIKTSEVRRKINDEYNIKLIEEGTSLVAINEKDGGRIVGMVIAGCQLPSDLERSRKKLAEMDPCSRNNISAFISHIQTKGNLFERYGISKLLLSHITTVVASMRGKGLGTRLAAALMEMGRSKGFPLMAAICTSYYSARQKESLGMECVYSLAYADYKDANGQVVFKLSDKHTHVKVMAIKL